MLITVVNHPARPPHRLCLCGAVKVPAVTHISGHKVRKLLLNGITVVIFKSNEVNSRD